MMQNKQIADWNSFCELANELIDNFRDDTYIFRGQSNKDWLLESTLSRFLKDNNVVDKKKALYLEEEMLNIFKENSEKYLKETDINIPKNDIFGWWMLMQHFGAPTRVIDWTKDSYIALYFAVSDNYDKDAALFVLDAGHLSFTYHIRPKENYSKEIEKSLNNKPYIKSIGTIKDNENPNERQTAQNGEFTITTEIIEEMDHISFANGVVFDGVRGGEGHSIFTKYIINKDQKIEFLKELDKLNINGEILFPGLDGLGKKIKEHAIIKLKL